MYAHKRIIGNSTQSRGTLLLRMRVSDISKIRIEIWYWPSRDLKGCGNNLENNLLGDGKAGCEKLADEVGVVEGAEY